MREVAPHVVACDHDTEFEMGLDIILAGLAPSESRQR